MSAYIVAFALIVIVFPEWTQQSGQPRKCTRNEQPVAGEPRKDAFCKPEITHPSLLNKLRNCLCKPGYIRNGWGHCIELRACQACKDKPNQDYSICESACPWTCGVKKPWLCTMMCAIGCSCPPGYVRAPGKDTKCVRASECPPKCPANSTFQACQSGCEPICGQPPPAKSCVPYCSRGGCVCQQGYAMLSEMGHQTCVPINDCPKDQVTSNSKLH